jgi:hypothetical protein
MTESGISSQQTDILNLPFWKKNESLLKELEDSEMPSKSRLVFKEISNKQDRSNDNALISYDLVNIYDNRKNFFSILAELTPDRSSVVKVEIIAGSKLSDTKKTVVHGGRITNEAYMEWLKEMSRNDVFQLFRT